VILLASTAGLVEVSGNVFYDPHRMQVGNDHDVLPGHTAFQHRLKHPRIVTYDSLYPAFFVSLGKRV
jgi:hypothetical protein